MVEIFDDIRKLYNFKAPCKELANYIEFFSETSVEATNQYITTEKFTVKLFPSFTPTIWINLGSPYILKNGRQQIFIDAATDILLLRNAIVERTNLRSDNIFTVKFHPGGFEAIFGIEQAKIGSEVLNLNTIFTNNIIKKFKRLYTLHERIALLENYFLTLLNVKFAGYYGYQKVFDAIHTFKQSEMKYSTNQLATVLATTNKTLYRYFKNTIGISPKNYFCIVRARTALTKYVSGKKTFSPYDYGYYDMSHFRKEVVQFTGQKLSAWVY
ncbi:AraC family transcriptional regulator [Ferruginibacter sp.]